MTGASCSKDIIETDPPFSDTRGSINKMADLAENGNQNKGKEAVSRTARVSPPLSEKSKCKKHDKNIKNKSNSQIDERVNNLERNISSMNDNITKLMGIIPLVNDLKNVIDNGLNYSSESDIEEITVDKDIDNDKDDELDYFRKVTGLKTTEGPKIDDMIASGVTNLLTTGFVNKDTKNQIADKYQIPGNCPRLTTLECNPEIYKKVRSDFRDKDKQLQNIQGEHIKSLTIQTYAFDKMNSLMKNQSIPKEIKQELSDIFTLQSDAVSISAHASHMLDVHRRKNFKPELKDELANVICNDNYPLKDSLFGELTDKLKNVSDNLKTSQNLRRFRFKPYHNRRVNFLGRRPFASNVRGGGVRRFQQNPFQTQRYRNPTTTRNQNPRIRRNRQMNQ